MYELPDSVAEAYIDLINLCESETDEPKKKRLEQILLGLSVHLHTVRVSREGYSSFQNYRFYGYDPCGEYVIERKTPGGICCYPILRYKRRTPCM